MRRLKNILDWMRDIEPVAMMAVGYLGDGYSLPPELLKRDETQAPRKSVNEYSFKNSLSNPAF